MVPLVSNIFTIVPIYLQMVSSVKKLVQMVKMVMTLVPMVQMLPTTGTIERTPNTHIVTSLLVLCLMRWNLLKYAVRHFLFPISEISFHYHYTNTVMILLQTLMFWSRFFVLFEPYVRFHIFI